MKHKTLTLLLLTTLILPACSHGAEKPAGRKNGVGETGTGLRPPDEAPVIGEMLETRDPVVEGQASAFPGQTRAVAVATKTALDIQVVARGLRHPWAMAFLPNGRVLVTEKPGAMRIVTPDGQVSKPLAGVPAVAFGGDGGLLDVVLDPAFEANRMIYFTYAELREGGSGVAVAKARLSDDERALENLTVILRVQPTIQIMGHYGSRLLFDKEGKLFVTLGERYFSPVREEAQSLNSQMGKILRINTDGTPAAKNPFIGTPGALPEIWSYGHRNPQGITTHPTTGEIWSVEHGPRGGDEVNIIQPGKNYGWPSIAYGTEYNETPVNGGLTALEGMEQPVYYWDPSSNPAGMAFYRGNLFPQWKNSLFVAMMNGKFVSRLAIANNKVVAEEALLAEMNTRFRDVKVGPDGAVYVLTDSGTANINPNTPPTTKLLKLTPR